MSNDAQDKRPRNVYQRIAAVMAEVDAVPKTGHNTQQGYKYIEQSRVMAELRPKLAAHGIVFVPNIVSSDRSIGTTKNGGQMFTERVTMDIALVNADDPSDRLVISWIAEGQDQTDKAINKAMTAAQKYALMKLFLISDAEDPDAAGEEVASTSASRRTETARTGQPSNGARPVAADRQATETEEAERRELIAAIESMAAQDQKIADSLAGYNLETYPLDWLKRQAMRALARIERQGAEMATEGDTGEEQTESGEDMLAGQDRLQARV